MFDGIFYGKSAVVFPTVLKNTRYYWQMHKKPAELVEAFVLCIGEPEITCTSTSSVTIISALYNCYILEKLFENPPHFDVQQDLTMTFVRWRLE